MSLAIREMQIKAMILKLCDITRYFGGGQKKYWLLSSAGEDVEHWISTVANESIKWFNLSEILFSHFG